MFWILSIGMSKCFYWNLGQTWVRAANLSWKIPIRSGDINKIQTEFPRIWVFPRCRMHRGCNKRKGAKCKHTIFCPPRTAHLQVISSSRSEQHGGWRREQTTELTRYLIVVKNYIKFGGETTTLWLFKFVMWV